MKERFNYAPKPGQIWQSSDPRRLSAFRVLAYINGGRQVMVKMLTAVGAVGNGIKTINVDRFKALGSKGYTRLA